MKLAVLCGGIGSRIRDVSDVISKSMIPLGNTPILWHIMKIYGYYGYSEFMLLLGTRGRNQHHAKEGCIQST
jgi:glucose-1-phosphate cytidylyltransferase